MGVAAQDARRHIQLIMLVNDLSLRNLIPAELAKGFGFYQSKPATVVLARCGDAGRAGRGVERTRASHLPLVAHLNGQPFGRPNAGVDMTFDFPRTDRASREDAAASAQAPSSAPARSPTDDRSSARSCLAERRMLEALDQGKPMTPFLSFGDRVRIEMFDAAGRSIFGAIDQRVVRAA